jgi:hypothetical protein
MKKSFEIGIIWLCFEFERETIAHKLIERVRESLAKRLTGSCNFLVSNFVVLFILGFGLDSLPWQLTVKEIY